MTYVKETMYEVLGDKDIICNLGCTHFNVPILRRIDLTIVETRIIPDTWARAYYDRGQTSIGYRAIDQYGTEWFRDWEGTSGDGPGFWKTSDRRILSVRANAEGKPQYLVGKQSTSSTWIDAGDPVVEW